ncbi:MAG: formimidoylglutamase [Chitinophagaceae bacterium]
MSDMFNLNEFLSPVDLFRLSEDSGYKEGQIGKYISVYTHEFPDLSEIDVVILGCGEERGSGRVGYGFAAPDNIRNEFYSLYYWHQDIRLADIGNVIVGETLNDTYAALETVILELINIGKRVIILGGSHDLTLAQYDVYRSKKKIIEASCIDAMIDLTIESPLRNDNFLMELLTGEPNYLRHYNHIAFQSYFVHPRMLETMDKLRFDCFRLGRVKENIEEMEPVIRGSHMLSIDISALNYAAAVANPISANGLDGEEICTLTQYAGMSSILQSIGIYGYRYEHDVHNLTARQIAQMMWYFLDGMHKGITESGLDEREGFNEFHTSFSEVATVFLQSKKTGRWWMQMPEGNFIACSYADYVMASSNEIPERWLRSQERRD